MQDSLYHSVLRIAMLVTALLLVFDSGFFSQVTKQLSEDTRLYLGQAVGMYAGVEATELNTVTAQLTELEQQLKERERQLTQREIAVGLNQAETSQIDSTFILSSLLTLILILVIINYILDFRRGRLFLNQAQT